MIFIVDALPIVDAGPDISICNSADPIDFTGTPAGVGPVAIGDVLAGYIEDQKMFDLKIK